MVVSKLSTPRLREPVLEKEEAEERRVRTEEMMVVMHATQMHFKLFRQCP